MRPDQTSPSRVAYASLIIDSMCALLGVSGEDDQDVVRIATEKLLRVWSVEYKIFGGCSKDQQVLRAKVYWDDVARSVNPRVVYSVLAVFGEPLNSASDTRRVDLTVGPANCVSRILIKLIA